MTGGLRCVTSPSLAIKGLAVSFFLIGPIVMVDSDCEHNVS